ncbi:Cytochrome p450 monooxygenase [Lasiodiplodia theobromae]|uniref:Cytochrome p450 monooxygenase n=1 Tax=Lasiodiplodia theobromae TaxID=45133 RepID=UPI0015C3702B|nr:Cytochrome p450 monooxygenase [Lasiodiplodia theobromae]KAF4536396.1 Cytochrome p450 monooxygenase [Lasiodiplodia theobromae]
MGEKFPSAGAAAIAGGVFLVLYMIYRAALPRPIPGIPHNKDAASKILGDIPEMMGHVKRTKRIFCWLTSRATRHQSPIVQVFIKPFSHPWVIVTDPFESHDILVRRTKEFDRSSFFGEILSGIMPEQHSWYKSNTALFKQNRNLINHLMAPTFINEVSAPDVYNAVTTVIKVWQLKCSQARGRPFSAHDDITYGALDAIFASSFGLAEEDSSTAPRLAALSQHTPAPATSLDEPVSFPSAAEAIPPIFSAVLTIGHSLQAGQLSPSPRLVSLFLRQLPYMRRATATKDAFIAARIDDAVRLIDANPADQPRNALHSVLLRSRSLAQKHGLPPPAPHSHAIADEFLGFLLAGHDTTATTVAWGVKHLSAPANHPAQSRLRAALRAALPDAVREQRAPSYAELASAHVPYLDAVVDEVLRVANTVAFVAREVVAKEGAVVLGRRVPYGAHVFFMADGAGYLAPGLKEGGAVDDMRSPGARGRSGGAIRGVWDGGDVEAFRPERWLRREDGEEGEERYDPAAGPSLPFGLGPRACFGRRLAVASLRIWFALIVWHFELLETPEELSGFEAVQKFAREPVKCYVRLRAVDM